MLSKFHLFIEIREASCEWGFFCLNCSTFVIVLRKLFAILLIFLTIGSAQGVTLFVHYCNGEASAISLFNTDKDPCATKEEDKCCEKQIEVKDCCINKHSKTDAHQVCKIAHEDCCNTQIIQKNGNEILSYRPAIKLQPINIGLISILSFDFLHTLTSNNLLGDINTHAPPIIKSGWDICVLISTFII